MGEELKKHHENTLRENNLQNGKKMDEMASKMWKAEEAFKDSQRKNEETKHSFKSKLDDLNYEYNRKLEDQKTVYQQGLKKYKSELRKLSDELKLTRKEVESMREKGQKTIEENFSLRRKLDEQIIEFDKKLLSVRKAVTFQAN